MSESFYRQLEQYVCETEEALDSFLPLRNAPWSRLIEAMRYSLLGGGKRLRAALSMAFCRCFCGDARRALPLACALEMVHAYSLIHDDLPCMDDDDLRRGKPSCHKAFDEATALLAGDALLTKAFALLAKADFSDKVKAKVMGELAEAIGEGGMIGGQVLDLDNEQREVDLTRLDLTNRMKTGALLQASARLGAIVGGAPQMVLGAVDEYGENIGLAFQIIDDILDVIGTEAQLGKPVGSDAQQHKATYAVLLPLRDAREKAMEKAAQAKEALLRAGIDDPFLMEFARVIVDRVS